MTLTVEPGESTTAEETSPRIATAKVDIRPAVILAAAHDGERPEDVLDVKAYNAYQAQFLANVDRVLLSSNESAVFDYAELHVTTDVFAIRASVRVEVQPDSELDLAIDEFVRTHAKASEPAEYEPHIQAEGDLERVLEEHLVGFAKAHGFPVRMDVQYTGARRDGLKFR